MEKAINTPIIYLHFQTAQKSMKKLYASVLQVDTLQECKNYVLKMVDLQLKTQN